MRVSVATRMILDRKDYSLINKTLMKIYDPDNLMSHIIEE